MIYGVVYGHALIDGNIFNKLKNSFKDSRCEIFIGQLDFYFRYQEEEQGEEYPCFCY